MTEQEQLEDAFLKAIKSVGLPEFKKTSLFMSNWKDKK